MIWIWIKSDMISEVPSLRNSAAVSHTALGLLAPHCCCGCSIWFRSKSSGIFPKVDEMCWFRFKFSIAASGARDDIGAKTSFSEINNSNDFCSKVHVVAPPIWFPVLTKFVNKNGCLLRGGALFCWGGLSLLPSPTLPLPPRPLPLARPRPRVLALVLQQLVPALTPSLPKNRASPETISDFNFSFNKIQWMIDVS